MTALTANTLVFDFPLPPNRANRYAHWAARHAQRKSLWRSLDAMAMVKRLPPPPRYPWAKAHAVLEVKTWRPSDPDNATARAKDCIDWLVSRGYLVDDGPTHLTLGVRATTAPRTETGITVTLTEVA